MRLYYFFFFNDTATTEIYTLSLHDALPIYQLPVVLAGMLDEFVGQIPQPHMQLVDRKSTRLNSSHGYISYAVFCLKKKKTSTRHHTSCLCFHNVQLQYSQSLTARGLIIIAR